MSIIFFQDLASQCFSARSRMIFLIAIAMQFLFHSSSLAQRISRTYQDVSLSEVLKDLSLSSEHYELSFIYNDLEDFRVTTSFHRSTLPEAVRQAVGFYPIRVTEAGELIVVECVQKTERHLVGTVTDEDGQPLAYANVAMLDARDSTQISSGISNESGYFALPRPTQNGATLLRVSYVGFKTAWLPCEADSMGIIRLEPETYVINGLTVKGERLIVKAENGHLVYNMSQLLEILPADDAYEALTRIPGVSDSGSGLSFAGQPVTLIINGRPTTLDAEQVVERLRQMPASMLAKAEVMPSAPAKYHVRGKAINVVTKDYTGTDHFSGQLQGTWLQNKYGRAHAKGNLLYNHGKLGMDISYSVTDGDNYGQVEHTANHPLGNLRVPYNDMTCNKSSGIAHNYRFGTDYAFADNHRLSAAYTGEWASTDSRNTTTGTAISTQKSRQHDYLHNVDFTYQMLFGLKVSASYTNYRNPRTQNLDGKLYEDVRLLNVNSRQRINKWLFSADQEHSLKNGWELSYGGKAQFSNNNSFQTTLDVHGGMIPDGTSSVDYDERIVNAYAGFSKQFGESLSIESSVEAEQYHAPKWNDWRLYPSFSLMWNAGKQHLLNLSFSSQADYPSYWSTMSSIYYTSAYSEIWGNPYLKPRSQYELNLMWQLKQRYTFSAFATWQPDYFVQLAYQPSDRMAVIMKETNFDYSNLFGLNSSIRFSSGQWLDGTVNLTGLYRHDKSSQFFDLPFDRHCFSAIFGANISVRFSSRQNILLMLNPFVQSKTIQGVYDIDALPFLSASLRWTSANSKWSLKANGQNILNTSAKTRSRFGNQDYAMRVWMQYRTFSLTAIYRIGSYKEKKTKAVDTSRMGY